MLQKSLKRTSTTIRKQELSNFLLQLLVMPHQQPWKSEPTLLLTLQTIYKGGIGFAEHNSSAFSQHLGVLAAGYLLR